MTTQESKPRICIKPVYDGPWCLCDTWADAADTIGHDVEHIVKIVKMTDAEVAALGEFNGW